MIRDKMQNKYWGGLALFLKVVQFVIALRALYLVIYGSMPDALLTLFCSFGYGMLAETSLYKAYDSK